MNLLLYIFGGLAVFIFFSWYLIPYIKKQLFWLKVKRKARSMAKNTDSKQGKERLTEFAEYIENVRQKEKL